MQQWYTLENEQEYKLAINRYEQIRLAQKGDKDYRERKLLIMLIQQYETHKWNLEELDPIELIHIRLKEYSMQASDLARIYGDKGTISKVLNKKQHLSLNMIRKFSKLLGIPAEALLKEYNIHS